MYIDKTQCPACGYIRAYGIEHVDEVQYFKSGPRKGEIKGSVRRVVDFNLGDKHFESVEIEARGYDAPGIRCPEGYKLSKETLAANICPKCGTIFKERT